MGAAMARTSFSIGASPQREAGKSRIMPGVNTQATTTNKRAAQCRVVKMLVAESG